MNNKSESDITSASMSTNRELLELAAKAAGYTVDWDAWDFTGNGIESVESDTGRIMPSVDGREWQPLTDDGDALRLAVKLRLMVHVGGVLIDGVQIQGDGVAAKELYGDDPYAATRRAIVRAAAEMGSTK